MRSALTKSIVMKSIVATFASALALVGLACASGGELDTAAGGSSAGGSDAVSSSESTSTSSASTTSGQGAGEPSGGPGATSSTGPSCSEQPCKLVAPQCGCAAGEQCTVDEQGDRGCGVEGSVAEGGICGGGDLCGPGTLCIGYDGFDSLCAAFCEQDGDCEAPGGKCLVEIASLPGVTLCTTDCEPISNQGCAVAGLSCQVGATATEGYTGCAPAGSVAAGEVCDANNLCRAGLVCLPTTANDDRCFAWCNVDNPNCGDVPCQGLEIEMGVPLMIGNVHYGVCSP